MASHLNFRQRPQRRLSSPARSFPHTRPRACQRERRDHVPNDWLIRAFGLGSQAQHLRNTQDQQQWAEYLWQPSSFPLHERMRTWLISARARDCRAGNNETATYAAGRRQPYQLERGGRRLLARLLQLPPLIQARRIMEILNVNGRPEAWLYYWEATEPMTLSERSRFPRPSWPLLKQMICGETVIHRIALWSKIGYLRRWLCNEGALGLEVRNAAGMTPLQSVLRNPHIDGMSDAANLLLDHGADATAIFPKTNLPWSGRTTAHLATCSQHSDGRAALVQRLISAGADPDILDETGKSLFDLAVSMGRSDCAAVAEQYAWDKSKERAELARDALADHLCRPREKLLQPIAVRPRL